MIPPLIFKPVYKDYLWGGGRIAERFGRTEVPLRCAESWEIADRDDGMSVVEGGPFAGRSLFELVHNLDDDLLGKGRKYPSFPILVKLIDAKERLSVQVHPNEENAFLTGGEAKTEMWYVINDPNITSNAAVYAGFKQRCSQKEFRERTSSGLPEDYESLFSRFNANPGDAFYIPGGRVHAIDQGCLLLEVQQNSNTTYRLWDWDRVGVDGKKRELHFEKALCVIDWNDVRNSRLEPTPIKEKNGLYGEQIIQNKYFTIRRYSLNQDVRFGTEQLRFEILFAPDNELTIEYGSEFFQIPMGRTCLVPAALGVYRIHTKERTGEVIRILPV